MPWSSVHRGDYHRMRKHLTVALLEAEALEPRMLLAYSHDEIPDVMVANLSVVKLMLERADRLTRKTLDQLIVEYHDIYAETVWSDRQLAGWGDRQLAG